MHHLISDGWSLGLIGRDLQALYRAELTGETDGLDPLPVRYRDYAAWQRERFTGDEVDEALAW